MKEKKIAKQDNMIIFEKLTVKEADKVKGTGPIISDVEDIKPQQGACIA